MTTPTTQARAKAAQLVELAERLTEAQIAALLTLPLPRAADPVRLIDARSFGSLWRKSAKHRDQMITLERRGIVERRVYRGETLWRPTREIGLGVLRLLRARAATEGRQ